MSKDLKDTTQSNNNPPGTVEPSPNQPIRPDGKDATAERVEALATNTPQRAVDAPQTKSAGAVKARNVSATLLMIPPHMTPFPPGSTAELSRELFNAWKLHKLVIAQ